MDSKSKVLVLVEGQKTDVRLMQHLFCLYGIDKKHEIISYNTNIYALYDKMFQDGDPEYLDILQSLKEHEQDVEKKKLLNVKYSDILLIFDLDPQDPRFSAEKILEMVRFFVESSDMGKLYLNYPMVESFYHMSSIPDKNYNSYNASLDELKHSLYKQRVSRENRNRDYRKFATTKAESNVVIMQNVEKAFLLTASERSTNGLAMIVPEAEDILVAQLKKLDAEQLISVLCTCVFYIAEYNPKFLSSDHT